MALASVAAPAVGRGGVAARDDDDDGDGDEADSYNGRGVSALAAGWSCGAHAAANAKPIGTVFLRLCRNLARVSRIHSRLTEDASRTSHFRLHSPV